MGISRLTALIIQTSNVSVETFRSPDEEKYGFIISRMERGNYQKLLSTKPYASNRDKAKSDGEGIVRKIKKDD